MLSAKNIGLQYGKKVLFEDVNINFTENNCYGIIGANGAGKSTFLKILSGQIEPNAGSVSLEKGKRMAVLNQNHFEYDNDKILDVVLKGHKILWEINEQKNILYAKENFSEKDGIKASVLENEFAELNGWNAESDAGSLLEGLGINTDLHNNLMNTLSGNQKIRVLLAQSLFGNPDVLILDEPTNDLDIQTINWLEDFLLNFKNTVIIVSHDRHFLDTVCTQIADIDFGKITLCTGNYSFWLQSSQLALKMKTQANKKAEEKKKELQEFVARFSANASKSKQATSRKKLLEKINIENIKPSSRKYPAILFDQQREAGNQILKIQNLSKKDNKENFLFKNLNLNFNKGDKIAVISRNHIAITSLFEILNKKALPSQGTFEFGKTIFKGYLPNDNSDFFKNENSLIDWLRDFSEEKDEIYIRGFLGKMLFSGEEVFKKSNVLSGGEKMRCMISRVMLMHPNFITLDEPTNHLDLESITALNNTLISYKGSVLFSSHDHQFVQTIANKIIELTPNGCIIKEDDFDSYLQNEKIQKEVNNLYF